MAKGSGVKGGVGGVGGVPGRRGPGRPRTFPTDGPDAEARPLFLRVPSRIRASVALLAQEWECSLSTAGRTLIARAIEAEIERREAELREVARVEAERVEAERQRLERERWERANTVTWRERPR